MKTRSNSGGKQQLTRREQQVRETKDALCAATIRCLDKYGYANTSTSRITQEAGVSRGALTHHFPTKEDLIVETTNKILRPAANLPKKPVPNTDLSPEQCELTVMKAELRRVWEQVANTAEARAFLEILIAYRTDIKLKQRIKPDLVRWNARLQDSVLQNYILIDGDDARLARVWKIARVFYRGLITHEAFVEDPKALNEIMEEFINMLAPMMRRR
ncbi:MAG: TetR/AcrR family transcriptional regulator [Xanthomonadales bacterium]|nr:TetR/AcrR family transcriptional regulator [Xanthomonadales bacterium]